VLLMIVLALNFVVTRITGGRERANGAGRQLLRGEVRMND